MTSSVSTQLVIFGLTGDLARRKLLPALYQLFSYNLMPKHIQIIGVSRRDVGAAEVLNFMREDPKYRSEVVDRMEAVTQMYMMNLGELDGYVKLKTLLDEQEKASNLCSDRLFYLSMPAQSVGPVISYLGEANLNAGCIHDSGESRLLIEKPFGYDLASAQELITHISRHFHEKQVYRIDHYVAKETSQNILTFRFGNPLFESVWNGRAIERIVITAAEEIGIEGRAVFFNQTGTLRDLIQSHLLQLLALVTMEEPADMSSERIHAAKLALLKSVVAPAPNEVSAIAVRGQYAGYTEEVGKQSSTETYAALSLVIDNDRWQGARIIIRSGKKLSDKRTEVTLVFKDRHTHHAIDNQLTFHIEPKEGVGMGILVKKPGLGHQTELAEMDFRYARSFEERIPDGYERVLNDALHGDRTLFSTSDEVLESWRIVQPVLDEWSKGADDLVIYKPGDKPEELSDWLG